MPTSAESTTTGIAPHDPTTRGGVIDGRAVAARIREQVRRDADAFAERTGRRPGLGTLLVGDNPASAVYIRMKHSACEQAGIASVHRTLPHGSTQEQVEAATAELVANDACDGVLVQMPLPPGIDSERVIMAVPPEKDVDGFHPANFGAVASGLHGTPPCTPSGVMTLLDEYGVRLPGAEAVVVGRSRTVGLPMGLLLMLRNATVTVTHHLTKDLAAHTRQAEVLVAAAGHPGLITADMVRPGAVVVDIGITRTDDGLRGDVDFDAVREVASLVSPVPGGVGPMTVATLLQATVRLARTRASALALDD